MSLALLLIGAGIVLYLLFWPIEARPEAWTPPQAPALEGTFATNSRLSAMERLPVGGEGPEDLAFDAQGRIYSGLHAGRIVRLRVDGSELATFARTGGRPLGLRFERQGNLLVADAYKGLLSITPDGAVKVLADEHAGQKLCFTNHLDVAEDGTIYFSESSTKFSLSQDIVELLENRPNGRLLAYDPTSRSTRLVLDNLYFANGVALSPDQSYVLVAETNRYRIRRVWLRGPRAGEAEIFVKNLPGFPDNISVGQNGFFWVALASPRKPDIDALYAKPFLRRVLLRLPRRLLPAATPYGFVLGIDEQAAIVENLQDPTGSFGTLTAAVEHDGALYLGSMVEDTIGRLWLG